MDWEDRPYEPAPDHYGTGRQPFRKRSLFSITLLLFALLIVANLVTLAFLCGYNVGKQQQETAAASPTLDTRRPNLTDVTGQVQGSVAEVLAESGKHMGIVLSSDGYILTTAEEPFLKVTVDGQSSSRIYTVGIAPELGLAVIKIDARELRPMSIGFCGTLSAPEENVIRYRSGSKGCELVPQTKQTERTLGGSQRRVLEGSYELGDLLLNDEGQLIALCVGVEDEVIALPMGEVLNLTGELLAFGSLDSPNSPGVEISLLDEAQSLYWGLPGNLMISRVQEGGSAYAAGLQEGDVLLEVAGVQIHSPADLWKAIDACKETRSIQIKIYRDNEEIEFRVDLE